MRPSSPVLIHTTGTKNAVIRASERAKLPQSTDDAYWKEAVASTPRECIPQAALATIASRYTYVTRALCCARAYDTCVRETRSFYDLCSYKLCFFGSFAIRENMSSIYPDQFICLLCSLNQPLQDALDEDALVLETRQLATLIEL